MISELSLRIALTAIREGHDIIRSGQTEPGLRLIAHGADYLQTFLPTPEPRIASELGIAADNLKKKAGAI